MKQTENKQVKNKPTTKKEKTKQIKKQPSNETNIAVKQEYFGHKENEDIWNSFLINKLIAHRGLHDKNSPENSKFSN